MGANVVEEVPDFFKRILQADSAVNVQLLDDGFDPTPDGQCKFPRLWPPQTPPGKDVGIMTVRC